MYVFVMKNEIRNPFKNVVDVTLLLNQPMQTPLGIVTYMANKTNLIRT